MKDCPVVRSFICLISGALTLAVAAAESPTVAKYRTLKEELLTCPENAFEAKRAEMLKFLADPGETNPVRLVEFYLDVVELIPGEHLSEPVVTRSKGDAPQQIEELDLDLTPKAGKKAVAGESDYDDEMSMYSDSDFNSDEIDLEGFEISDGQPY